MRFGELRSIGHNIADSFASGIGLLIGVYEIHVFEEARRSPGGFIEVDFLKGVATAGRPSQSLERAIFHYARALPTLCLKHGCTVGAFRRLAASFWCSSIGPQFEVTVEDHLGRCGTDQFVGLPGKYIRTLDAEGRVRRKRSRASRGRGKPAST